MKNGMFPKFNSSHFSRAVAARCGFFLGILVFCAAPVATAQEFVGAKRCKTCHEFEYLMWSKGPHAKAQKHLHPEQLKDSKCNTCHTTAPGESDERLVNVQCERCHGPGQYYHRPYVMKDKELARAVGLVTPSPSHCLQCHTEGAPNIKPFNFKEMWAKIAHGGAARKAWEEAQARVTPVLK